jgi:DNA end-binding protein Ku
MRTIVGATLTFGAVFVPVNVASSAQKHEVSLNTTHVCGSKVNQMFWCPECSKPAEKEDLRKGFKIGKAQFVEVDDELFKEITGERSREITINKFIPQGQIDLRMVDKQYALAPSDNEILRRSYKLIVDAMLDDTVGLGKARLWGKEQPVAIVPGPDGLLWMLMLHTHDELVTTIDEERKLAGVEVTPEEVALARQFIELKTGDLEPSDLTSSTYERQLKFIDDVVNGKKPRKRRAEKEKAATLGEMEPILRKMVAGAR